MPSTFAGMIATLRQQLVLLDRFRDHVRRRGVQCSELGHRRYPLPVLLDELLGHLLRDLRTRHRLRRATDAHRSSHSGAPGSSNPSKNSRASIAEHSPSTSSVALGSASGSDRVPPSTPTITCCASTA